MPIGPVDVQIRILALVTDAFGGNGGIAKYSRDFLTALCSYPSAAKVVAIPRLAPEPPGQLPERLEFDVSATRGPLRYLAAVGRRLFPRRRFDVVYCGHVNLLPVAWLAARLVGAELWLQIYGVDAWRPPANPIRLWLVSGVDRVISISRFTLSQFLSWSGVPEGRCVILPNAVSVERFGVGPRQSALLERFDVSGRTVLLTLGRLEAAERAKGFDEILELMPSLEKDIPGIVYVVAGDGNDRDRLEQKAERLGVRESVLFTGVVSEAEKADLFRAADVFVMPSRLEGFGFVFLEALACGVPVVASAIDGGSEAIHDGEWGVLVDPRKPEDIKRGILEALKRPREVPPGLQSYSFESFSRRLHEFVGSTLK